MIELPGFYNVSFGIMLSLGAGSFMLGIWPVGVVFVGGAIAVCL